MFDACVQGDGPYPEGAARLLGAVAVMFPDFKIERVYTLLCGDKVTVLSKLTGTGNAPPPGSPYFLMFPNIDPAKLKGKQFVTYALEVHAIRQGKIKQSWSLVDWSTALDQMINGAPVPDFGFSPSYVKDLQ